MNKINSVMLASLTLASLFTGNIFAEKIQGRIINHKGFPVRNVEVKLNGSQEVVFTDSRGFYELDKGKSQQPEAIPKLGLSIEGSLLRFPVDKEGSTVRITVYDGKCRELGTLVKSNMEQGHYSIYPVATLGINPPSKEIFLSLKVESREIFVEMKHDHSETEEGFLFEPLPPNFTGQSFWPSVSTLEIRKPGYVPAQKEVSASPIECLSKIVLLPAESGQELARAVAEENSVAAH